MNSAKGFLLSYLKYGDNDAVIHCFTEGEGYESFFVRGLYAAKNKKKAFLQPLNELSVGFSDKKSGTLKSVSKFELLGNLDFEGDIRISTMVFFLSDFLNQVLRNESQNNVIYHEIENLISELRVKNLQSHLIFLFKFLKIQGLSPLVGTEIFLNPEKGIFTTEKSHHLFDEAISKIWKTLSGDETYHTAIPPKLRRNFLESLLVYYHYHFTDFRIPQSLEIVQQIFD